MAVEPQVQQFIDFIRDEMPRRIKTNPNNLPNAEKLLVSVSGTLEVIYKTLAELDIAKKSDLVKDILTLLDQVADQTLVANTTYEIGEYTNTLNLLMPDPVPGGTTVTLAVPLLVEAPVGDINISFPVAKPLFGSIPSLPLKSTLYPLPGDRIVFIYEASASRWMVYKTVGRYYREMYVVSDSAANPDLDPSFFHRIISKATDGYQLIIPNRTVDLDEVGQTEFFDNQFRIKNSTNPTKKIAFNGSGITAGQTRLVTVPDYDVDLGNVAQEASTSTNGYLTSTDWNTFNNKEQGGYITVSSNFTAEVGKKYRTVHGLSSAITITPPATTVDGAYFTVFYTYMTSTGSVTCTNPTISAGPKDIWQEYEYTYDATAGGWLPLRKSLGPIVPTGSSFQLVNPTTPDAKFIIQAPTSSGLYTLTMPNADVDLGDMAKVSNQRYQFVSNPDSTYTVPASAVTATGRTIIELSNNSLTSITINTATGTDKVAGDSVNISITGTYAAQELFGSGVTLEGDLTFSYQYQTKTLVYKGSNTWKVVG